MLFLKPNRALLQGIVAGALALAAAGACSRPDRTETGSDNSAALTQDTAATAPVSGAAVDTGAATDPGLTPGTTTETGAATGDTAPAQIQSDAPRAATAPPSAETQDTLLEGDSAAAGYRPMERDTANVPDTSEISADTGEVSAQPADTVAVDTTLDTSVEMARDTTTTADQIDTTGAIVVAVDTTTTAAQVDTTAAGVSGDVALEATIDTANADVAVGAADTAESDRVRPPEDSTELYGDPMSDETADEQEIRAEDRETVAAYDERTDEVGAAAVAGNITGSQAVELMIRQGATCILVDPESNEEVRWDMSNTPVTLNPCGLGTMNPSRIWTER